MYYLIKLILRHYFLQDDNLSYFHIESVLKRTGIRNKREIRIIPTSLFYLFMKNRKNFYF